MNTLLSVIIPSFNEEGMIHKTSQTISRILEDNGISYELIFVNDGSTDSTWVKIQSETEHNSCIKGINFSRNFGKESAIYAGLFYSSGDCCVVIDCDLQHPPEKIVEMYRLWENGYEIIEGIKHSRGQNESRTHFFAAKCFYKIISRLTDIDMSRASDFKLLDRKAVNALLNIKEKNAFFRALSSWIGFKTTTVEFDVRERDWRDKMVYLGTGKICSFQYFFFFCRPDADCLTSGFRYAADLSGIGRYCPVSESDRDCPGRLHYRHNN